MTTNEKYMASSKSNTFRFLLPVFIISNVLVSAAMGAQGEAKTHTLFMGADVSIGFDNQLYAVRDVSGNVVRLAALAPDIGSPKDKAAARVLANALAKTLGDAESQETEAKTAHDRAAKQSASAD